MTEAGWYADPVDPTRVRWWDGAAWTEHAGPTAPVEPTGITLAPALEQERVPVPPGPGRVSAPPTPAATIPAESAAPLAAATANVPRATAQAPTPAMVNASSSVAVLDRPGDFLPEAGVAPPQPPRDLAQTPVVATLRPGAYSGVPTTSALPGTSRRVPWVWLLVSALLLGALGAAVALVGMPWYRARMATEAAAAVSPAVAQTPPPILVRQRQATLPGLDGTALAAGLLDQGASWAWVAAYGRESNRALYLAAELPRDQWATATLALEDPVIAGELMAAVGSGLVAGAGGDASVAAAREYATLGVGRTWCREIWVRGQTGGHCLWTNGREMLQAVHLPGVESLAAKKTLAALSQLGRPAP